LSFPARRVSNSMCMRLLPWLTPWWVSERRHAALDASTPGSPRYVVLDPRGRLEPTISVYTLLHASVWFKF
jgi:hypothetical protein